MKITQLARPNHKSKTLIQTLFLQKRLEKRAAAMGDHVQVFLKDDRDLWAADEQNAQALPGAHGEAAQKSRRAQPAALKKGCAKCRQCRKTSGSFESRTQIPPETGCDFSYHNLVCPLANFAKECGYEAYLPYLCNLDYVMFGIMGVPLLRTCTCFDGSYCDFTRKVDAQPMPYWPPVFSQGNGYK